VLGRRRQAKECSAASGLKPMYHNKMRRGVGEGEKRKQGGKTEKISSVRIHYLRGSAPQPADWDGGRKREGIGTQRKGGKEQDTYITI